MSGRSKVKVYEYSKEGKYLRTFFSMSKFFNTYNLTNATFQKGRYETDNIYEFPDGRIASTERIGRKGVRLYYQRKKSPFVGKGKKTAISALKNNNKLKKVKVYDLDNDLIAVFNNPYSFRKLTNIDCRKDGKKSTYNEYGLKIVIE